MSPKTKRVVPLLLITAPIVIAAAALAVSLRSKPSFRHVGELIDSLGPDASAIKLIDSFAGGEGPNAVGGDAFAQAFGGAEVSKEIFHTDTPDGDGRACVVTYGLPGGTSGIWGTDLNELDISAATSIEFWLWLKQGRAPELSLELIDMRGGKASRTLEELSADGQWHRYALPLEGFKGVDFNGMARLIIRMGAREGAVSGSLGVDQIAFLGPSEVFFRSIQDNLFGFPRETHVDDGPLLELEQRELFKAIARDTWGFFRDIVDKRHHLPLNYVQTAPDSRIGDYASTTDIAMYLMSIVSAMDLDILDRASALEHSSSTLATLERLDTWNGLFYNYYSTTNLQVTRRYVSSVDNGWLAASLVVMRQAFPELYQRASAMLTEMDFGIFYDPKNGQMRLGYDEDKGEMAPYHYGLFVTEARIISAIAVGKGDVPAEHWFSIYRTLPSEWEWQMQPPQGVLVSYDGQDLFQGYYEYGDDGTKSKIVPSWGGSLFEFLMPTLVIDEKRLAPRGLGLNNQRAVDIHIHYALKEQGYRIWGLSPCATPKEKHGGYAEFGIGKIGAKGYKDEGIVTPHVSFLSLAYAPEAVETNVRAFIEHYELYGPYGFYDAVDSKTGDAAHRYLALDQGMSLIALNNFLNDGAIQRRFEKDPVMGPVRGLLEMEDFFASPSMAKDAL